MHGNLRYVKSVLIGLTTALAVASPAQAELVTGRADRGVLAVEADGTPYVAWTIGRVLFVSVRNRQGSWRLTRLGTLPGSNANLAGITIGERPHHYVSVLAQDTEGRWISLARGSRVTSIARAGPGSSYGPAGLALDAHGRPAVAYAVQRASAQTFLRLATFDSRGRLHRRAITQKGFPTSALSPGAAPVLVNGRLHVVETYTSAAIDWAPTANGGWEGQFLFASLLGSPQGHVGAISLAPTLWSAWTQVYPETPPGDLVVLLNSSSDTQESWELTHGIFVSIARGESMPEVAAYDWVTIAGGPVFAGLVLQPPGGQAWQLDGRLDGFAIGRAGARQLLLFREGELQWFRAPAALPGIRITMHPVDPEGRASGSVAGATGGTVQIYRERGYFSRELVATSAVAADGSFEASGLGSSDDNLYRAVYVEPTTTIPFSFLPGVSVGTAG
jgi:hypothetical protein